MSPLSSFITLMAGGLWPWLLKAFGFGYLLGSIPFGLILTRVAGLGDVRKIGSGNIGATNVLRTGNKGLAAATLLLDGLKGTAAVLIADHYFGQVPAMLAGLGAFLGHLYPVWLKFKGGKGVATYIGVLAGLVWQGAAVNSDGGSAFGTDLRLLALDEPANVGTVFP
jgi:glycerol-3-phosphate acyltransferase PlsY